MHDPVCVDLVISHGIPAFREKHLHFVFRPAEEWEMQCAHGRKKLLARRSIVESNKSDASSHACLVEKASYFLKE